MTLMGEVREIVVQAAKQHKFTRVRRVVLEIGQLSGVQAESMRFCFDVVMEHTPAEGATLEIEEIPGLAWCNHCGREVEITSRVEPCPSCSGMPGKILQGTEMRVKGLEVE